MIGRNSQLRNMLGELTNSLQASMDTVSTSNAQECKTCRRRWLMATSSCWTKWACWSTKPSSRTRPNTSRLDKVLRDCRALHEAFSEFKTVRVNFSDYKQALKPEFEEVHGMIAELKTAAVMTDQEVKEHFTTLETNVKKLHAAIASFETKVASSFVDIQTRDNGLNGKFANYHAGQLSFQDGLQKSIAAIGTQTTTPQIQEIVQGCLQNDPRLLSMNTHLMHLAGQAGISLNPKLPPAAVTSPPPKKASGPDAGDGQKTDTAQTSQPAKAQPATSTAATAGSGAPAPKSGKGGEKTPAKSVSLADAIAPPSTNDMAQVAQTMQVPQGIG